jgi:hypothetical protein
MTPTFKYISRTIKLSRWQSLRLWFREVWQNAKHTEWRNEMLESALWVEDKAIPSGWHDTGLKARLDSYRGSGPKVKVKLEEETPTTAG